MPTPTISETLTTHHRRPSSSSTDAASALCVRSDSIRPRVSKIKFKEEKIEIQKGRKKYVLIRSEESTSRWVGLSWEERMADTIRGVHVQMGWAELGRENGRHCRDVSGEIADWLRERRPSLAVKLDIEADEIENEEEWDWVFRD
nr:hypothetical protein Iba_chr11dCG11330 [Ipomoea batatas]